MLQTILPPVLPDPVIVQVLGVVAVSIVARTLYKWIKPYPSIAFQVPVPEGKCIAHAIRRNGRRLSFIAKDTRADADHGIFINGLFLTLNPSRPVLLSIRGASRMERRSVPAQPKHPGKSALTLYFLNIPLRYSDH